MGEPAQSAENFLKFEETAKGKETIKQVYFGAASRALFNISLSLVNLTLTFYLFFEHFYICFLCFTFYVKKH